MKKFIKIALALVLATSILLSVACAEKQKEPKQTDEPMKTVQQDLGETELLGEGKKIAFITPLSGLGDGAIGDATYEGLLAAQKELGFELDYSEPMDARDLEMLLIEYAESGEYEIIFLAAFECTDIVLSVGGDYPNQKYLIYDNDVEGHPQVTSQYFAKNEIGFLAGVTAALMEEKGEITISGETTTFDPTGKIGLIIGKETPSTVPSITGAAAGIKFINPEYDYLYAIVGDWIDQAKNKEIALSMYDEGVHIIYPNAGGGGLGIIAAAQERGQYFIGYDSDQTDWDPERVIGSSVKRNTDVIVRVLRQYFETGQLLWGSSEENNASNDGIGFMFNEGFEVPEDVEITIQEVMTLLKNGTIKAPNTWEEVDAFDDVLDR